MNPDTESAIYARYVAICQRMKVKPEKRMDFAMTIHFADKEIPLDLERLLAFPDFDFTHDVGGMLNYMDRQTCKLTRCFVPRCAKPTVPA